MMKIASTPKLQQNDKENLQLGFSK